MRVYFAILAMNLVTSLTLVNQRTLIAKTCPQADEIVYSSSVLS